MKLRNYIPLIFALAIISVVAIGFQPALERIFPLSVEHVAHKQWLKESFDIPRRVNENSVFGLEATNKARQAAFDAQMAVFEAGVTEIAHAREVQVAADAHLATLEAWSHQLFNQFGRELAQKYPQVPQASDYYYDFDRKWWLETAVEER